MQTKFIEAVKRKKDELENLRKELKLLNLTNQIL